MITRLMIPQEYLRVSARGKEAEFVRTPEVAAILKDHYGRDGLCLKMFRSGADYWGSVPMKDAIKVQNIFSWYKLAPRVYGLVSIPDGEGRRLAQVTDFCEKSGAPRKAKAQQIADKYRIACKDGDTHKQLSESHRWIGSKTVDFGRFWVADESWYARKMRKHVIRYHKKPHREAIGYHPCPELGVKGVREIDSRIAMMDWDSYDWKGRTVLDLGCNSCAFSREAAKRGAARVIAVDHKLANKNRELNNWLGYWNIDHLQLSFPKQWKEIRRKTGIKRFDIVICLSMVGHAGGYKGWLPELCGNLLFFSGQGSEDRTKYQAKLERDFAQAEWRGYATDNGRHPVWVCHMQHHTSGIAREGTRVAVEKPQNIAYEDALDRWMQDPEFEKEYTAQGVTTALDEPLEA